MQGWTSGISITLVLILLGLITLSLLTARNLSRYVKENISFTIYADPDTGEADMLRMQSELTQQPYVKEAVYVSAAQALTEQSKELGTDPSEFLGYNPYTPMIEVRLREAYANTDSIQRIETALKRKIQIAEIGYQTDLINSVNRNIRFIALILTGLAILFSLISFALISNTMRMAVYSKRFVIHTMQLVGAGWGFIRYPFVARCVGIGLLAALISCFLIGSCYLWLVDYEPSLYAILTMDAVIWSAVVVIVGGVLLTGLASLLSMNHYLRVKHDRLFYL
jgi:cell division transport system permease protein